MCEVLRSSGVGMLRERERERKRERERGQKWSMRDSKESHTEKYRKR